MELKVTKVVKANTFEVFPPWRWEDQSGIKVKVANIETPSEGAVGYKRAKDHLKSIVEKKKVELKNKKDVDFDCLVCDVYIDGENIKSKL
jgi:hypothetical protein